MFMNTCKKWQCSYVGVHYIHCVLCSPTYLCFFCNTLTSPISKLRRISSHNATAKFIEKTTLLNHSVNQYAQIYLSVSS